MNPLFAWYRRHRVEVDAAILVGLVLELIVTLLSKFTVGPSEALGSFLQFMDTPFRLWTVTLPFTLLTLGVLLVQRRILIARRAERIRSGGSEGGEPNALMSVFRRASTRTKPRRRLHLLFSTAMPFFIFALFVIWVQLRTNHEQDHEPPQPPEREDSLSVPGDATRRTTSPSTIVTSDSASAGASGTVPAPHVNVPTAPGSAAPAKREASSGTHESEAERINRRVIERMNVD